MADLKSTTRRSYTKLLTYDTFEERYEYLKLSGSVGKETFGHKRYLNQKFYTSKEWRDFRREIILRDGGCDLGIPGREIHGKRNVYIHHLNPITDRQILDRDPAVLDPENAICVTYNTHEAIHYGSVDSLIRDPQERKPGDTCPWKKPKSNRS